MDKQSLFFTFLAAFFSLALMFQFIIFFTKRKKIITFNNDKLSVSYAIWFSSILISFAIYLKVALQHIENSIEYIIFADEIENAFLAVMEKIAVFIGFTFLSVVLVYYLVNIISNVTFGKRIEKHEIENENYSYFILKGIAMIIFVLATLPIFEHFTSWFLIKIEIPFYK